MANHFKYFSLTFCGMLLAGCTITQSSLSGVSPFFSHSNPVRQAKSSTYPAGSAQSLDVYFATDRHDVTPSMEKLFSELADQFHNRTWLSIVIEGHTDSHASQDYNMKLAYRRTNSVKAALIRVGFPEELIVELPKGESQPVASNETSVGRQLNRRVKVWFTQ